MCIFCERARAEQAARPLDAPSTPDQLAAEKCVALRAARVRATIVCGPLGAGKTSLLSSVLGEAGRVVNDGVTDSTRQYRLGIVQNEFGEVSIDDGLLQGKVDLAGGELVVAASGCLCCRVRGDLAEGLRQLAGEEAQARLREIVGDGRERALDEDGARWAAERTAAAGTGASARQASEAADAVVAPTATIPAARRAVDHVLIECSGLSELAPVIQTFFADQAIQANYTLSSVVCVVDAPRLHRASLAAAAAATSIAAAGAAAGAAAEQTLVEDLGDPVLEHIMRMLPLADIVIVNKVDLVRRADRDAAVAFARASAAGLAEVVLCRHGKINARQLLFSEAFNFERGLARVERQLAGAGGARPHVHKSFTSFGVEESGVFSGPLLEAFFKKFCAEENVIERLKGWVTVQPFAADGATADGDPVIFEVHTVEGHVGMWPVAGGDKLVVGQNKLILIGKFGELGGAAAVRSALLAARL